MARCKHVAKSRPVGHHRTGLMTSMKFLIDTNVFIPLEPTRGAEVEAGTSDAAAFARQASAGGHTVYVHPAALNDLQRDKDAERRRLRERLFEKYPPLPEPPAVPAALALSIGQPVPGTNAWVDNQLLAALYADAIDVLVTEDRQIHSKANRVGLGPRVATVADANNVLKDLFDKLPSPPPAVVAAKAHSLPTSDPIWASLKADYPGFDAWLQKCRREHRQTWAIYDHAGALAAVAIVNREEHDGRVSGKKVLKLCTFKVSQRHGGLKYGELLLKAIFGHAQENGYDTLFTTTFERQVGLVALLEEFGFVQGNQPTPGSEIVLVKALVSDDAARAALTPLEFHVRFGPRALKLDGENIFFVPIRPEYHGRLFPDAESQMDLLPGQHAYGNAIRKAYLCNAPIRSLRGGDVLLFYRSETGGIRAVGVVEQTLVSNAASRIAAFVGKRTVYKYEQIEALCGKEVLAILFRHALNLTAAVPLATLSEHAGLKAAPQSITQVPPQGLAWVRRLLTS
jgi:GNAT superfamily N-acetyltransferase